MTTPPLKLSFGLKQPTKLAPAKPKSKSSSIKPARPLLGHDDDDDDNIVPTDPSLSLASSSRPRVSTTTLPKAQKAKQAADLALDESVYEYDGVYDQMKQGALLASASKRQDAGERKVRSLSFIATWSALLTDGGSVRWRSRSTLASSRRRQRRASATACAQRTR